jgi:hypothetical protein
MRVLAKPPLIIARLLSSIRSRQPRELVYRPLRCSVSGQLQSSCDRQFSSPIELSIYLHWMIGIHPSWVSISEPVSISPCPASRPCCHGVRSEDLLMPCLPAGCRRPHHRGHPVHGNHRESAPRPCRLGRPVGGGLNAGPVADFFSKFVNYFKSLEIQSTSKICINF